MQAVAENPSLLMSHLASDRKQLYTDAAGNHATDNKKDQRRKKAVGVLQIVCLLQLQCAKYNKCINGDSLMALE